MKPDLQKIGESILLSKYTPASVVIDEALDIVYFHGNTERYLAFASGDSSHNLFKMAKKGLAFELRYLLDKTKQEHGQATIENIHFHDLIISMEAIPLSGLLKPHYLVLFHDHTPRLSSMSVAVLPPKTNKDEKDLRILQLEKALTQSREDLYSFTAGKEADNEALQNLNEELESSNEELQTLNEELEATTEELMSNSEALTMTNQELLRLNEQVTIEQHYAESIISAMRDPLLVLDTNLRIKSANQSFYRFFQTTARKTEGKLIYDLGDKRWNTPALIHLLENILPLESTCTGYEIHNDFPLIGKRTMLLNANKMASPKTGEQWTLLVFEDITDQLAAKNKSQEIQQLHALELEEKVHLRTLELSVANKDLRNLNKDLESFTYISSHDLQEPLRKIQTFAKLIGEKEFAVLSDRGKDYFHRIQEAAMRMQMLIKDLLAFSLVNTIDKTFEKTDLNLLVTAVKNDLNALIQKKNAIISMTGHCEANVIPVQFKQLFQQIISNALLFSKPERPPIVLITSEMTLGRALNAGLPTEQKLFSDEKGYCHIAVSDNGIGFNPEYKDRIFELFQRLHEKKAIPGTGIGLSIVKKIVENHYGVITATGEPDKGARFDIYIPA